MTSMDPAVEIEKVSLGYGRSLVLSVIDMVLMPGEFLALVGPNGSGKSTLIRGISKVLPLASGTIKVEGKSIAFLSRMELARVLAVVPQTPALPESFTSLELVLLGRTPYLRLLEGEGPDDLAIARQAMELTGTWALRDRRIGEISGGERQRVVIARALAQEPRVLLMDEPTAHLDINHQVEILELARYLCRTKGIAVLAALHDLNLASQYADRIVILNGGKIAIQGRPEEVITAANIKMVFGAEVQVVPHPVNRLPVTIITSKDSLGWAGQASRGDTGE